jgi:lipopolysaccharide transport system ATP-binding protein
MSDSDVLVRVEHVSKKFCRNLRRSLWYGVQDLGSELIGQKRNHETLRRDEFWAVDDVSFELKRGECLGLIGHNGAGKTTLLRMLNGLITPDRGRIAMRGRVGALISLGAGFNPILSGRENIYTNAAILGFSHNDVKSRFDEIVRFSGLEDFLDAPVQSYSAGMHVRLGFSIASHLDVDVLLLDEVLAVGDIGFRTRCYNRLAKLKEQVAAILISHQMPDVARLCDRAILLDGGRTIFGGSVTDVFSRHEHSSPEAPFIHTEHGVRLHNAVFFPPVIEWGTSVCSLRASIDSDERHDGLFARLTILDQSGACVAEWQSENHEPLFSIGPGNTALDFRIEGIRLAAGKYRMNFIIGKKGGVAYLALHYGFAELVITGSSGGHAAYQL